MKKVEHVDVDTGNQYLTIFLPVKKNYKYFNGYLYDFEITPLYIMLPKTRTHVKIYGT